MEREIDAKEHAEIRRRWREFDGGEQDASVLRGLITVWQHSHYLHRRRSMTGNGNGKAGSAARGQGRRQGGDLTTRWHTRADIGE